jgi:hypothetical protein
VLKIFFLNSSTISVQWWYSERFLVITRQLQAAKCSLRSQLFGHTFTLLENFPTVLLNVNKHLLDLFALHCSCIKNLLFNFSSDH